MGIIWQKEITCLDIPDCTHVYFFLLLYAFFPYFFVVGLRHWITFVYIHLSGDLIYSFFIFFFRYYGIVRVCDENGMKQENVRSWRTEKNEYMKQKKRRKITEMATFNENSFDTATKDGEKGNYLLKIDHLCVTSRDGYILIGVLWRFLK